MHVQEFLRLDVLRRKLGMKRREMDKRREIDFAAMEDVRDREKIVKDRENRVKKRREDVRKRREDVRKREEDVRKREEDALLLLENAKNLQEERAKAVQSREIKVSRRTAPRSLAECDTCMHAHPICMYVMYVHAHIDDPSAHPSIPRLRTPRRRGDAALPTASSLENRLLLLRDLSRLGRAL